MKALCLFNYACPFSGHQALKGFNWLNIISVYVYWLVTLFYIIFGKVTFSAFYGWLDGWMGPSWVGGPVMVEKIVHEACMIIKVSKLMGDYLQQKWEFLSIYQKPRCYHHRN